MKKQKLFSIIPLGLLILGLTLHNVIADTQYTSAQVSEHNSADDCWVIYEQGVYDITTYLPIHNQRYSNITSWCGTDMTDDYNKERKHTNSTDNLLETFRVGTLTAETQTTETTVSDTKEVENTSTTTSNADTEDQTSTNPYNLLAPILIATIFYWGHYIYAFKICKPQKGKAFNAFWNTMLALSFLIPTLGFGIIMILQYQVPTLASSSFDFLYWHVELSLFMGTVGLFHFLKRIKIYWAQLKKNA